MKVSELMDKITGQILADLEKGVLPWEQPWIQRAQFPKNAATGRLYRGVNVFWLSAIAEKKGYSSNHWLTFLQAKGAGGRIKAGSTSTEVVFFSSMKFKEKDQEVEEAKEKTVRLLKFFRVFNLDQTEGLERLKPAKDAVAFPQNEEAERLVKLSGAKIVESIGGGAYFNPKEDFIGMPERGTFTSEEAYYSVLFHEMTHWTGHAARLNRKQSTAHGSSDYAFEELVAELGGTFLCGQLNYLYETRHASYVHNWLQVFKGDARAIVRASSLAQSAADYLQKLAGTEKAEGTLVSVGE